MIQFGFPCSHKLPDLLSADTGRQCDYSYKPRISTVTTTIHSDDGERRRRTATIAMTATNGDDSDDSYERRTVTEPGKYADMTGFGCRVVSDVREKKYM